MQQSRKDMFIDFLLKAATFTWVNYALPWHEKQTPAMRWGTTLAIALLVAYLLTYIIHPWRRRKRAERRAARLNQLSN
jgi:peptidoglycan/LPS O-acetylase OafA/YrhL